jgi:hypothetical protein
MTRSGHKDRHCRSHAFLTISKPLAVNSFRMLLTKWEHSSGLIQVALLQSGSSSLEYAVNADRIPASIALVTSSAMRPSTTSLTTGSWHSHGSVDVDQRCFAGGKDATAPRRETLAVQGPKPSRRSAAPLRAGERRPLRYHQGKACCLTLPLTCIKVLSERLHRKKQDEDRTENDERQRTSDQ